MQYSIGSNIECGCYGQVYKVKKNGQVYAAKVLPKHRILVADHKNLAHIQREIHNHKKVNGHPNIVKLVDVVQDWGNYYLIEEYCSRGDLKKYINENKVAEHTAKKIIIDCLHGLLACHKAGFIFGDLKPSNILVSDDNNFKLCDFGASDKANDLYSGCDKVRGTPIFLAPEAIIYKQNHGFISDMWSLGILAYLLMYDHFPYKIECSPSEFLYHLKTNDISYSYQEISPIAEDFIRKCLEKDALKRMSPEEALKHEFLRT
jgi:serine/threonine protein kinase